MEILESLKNQSKKSNLKIDEKIALLENNLINLNKTLVINNSFTNLDPDLKSQKEILDKKLNLINKNLNKQNNYSRVELISNSPSKEVSVEIPNLNETKVKRILEIDKRLEKLNSLK